jgi:hypothetical protein
VVDRERGLGLGWKRGWKRQKDERFVDMIRRIVVMKA